MATRQRGAVLVLVSGALKMLKSAMEAICRQSMQFNKVVVIPWGDEGTEIKNFVKSQPINTEIVSRSCENTLEGSRNNALRSITNNPPDWVAFIDDDTIIDPSWLYEMMGAGNALGNKFSLASLCISASNPNIVQSAGHILFEGRPLDCGYGKPVSAVCTSYSPLCPCGNSAFVPWEVIEKIRDLDEDVWDPRFKQWQTCFDFGLKLRLVGISCRLVRSALVRHEGVNERKKGVLAKEDVRKQLRSRILLYEKFYPVPERTEAIEVLKKRLHEKWKNTGYPNAKWLRGEEMVETFESALAEEKELKERGTNIWVQRMNNMDEVYRRALLFGGSIV
jgi:GT2 family glycosyltransferase